MKNVCRRALILVPDFGFTGGNRIGAIGEANGVSGIGISVGVSVSDEKDSSNVGQ